MRIVNDKPFGLASSENFIGMGTIKDGSKHYVCLLDIDKAKEAVEKSKSVSCVASISMACYIEEVHFKGRAYTWETSTFHQIKNDEEWESLVAFVMHKTTIFSPKKIKDIVEGKIRIPTTGTYVYSKKYLDSAKTNKDLMKRKKAGLL